MDGFSLIRDISKEAEKVITGFLSEINFWTASVASLAAICFTLWLLYRAYQVLGGWQEASVSTILKDAIIVYVILFIAGSTAAFTTNVSDFIKETPAKMVKGLVGEDKAATVVENKMIVLFDGLDKLSEATPPPQDDPYEANFKGDLQRNATELWNKFLGGVKKITEPFDKILSVIFTFIKLMIILAGLMFLAFSLTKIILINKTYFMLCLGVGPLFLMFAAFKATRNWFNSWLNHLIGYGFSYVMVMFAAKVLLGILDVLWQDGVSWLNAFVSFFVCIALSFVIARVGDIVSAWFSAGNIADGTAAAAAVAVGSMGGRVKGMAQTVGSNTKDAIKKYQNRGQDKMSRYNTRHTYNKNREEAAANAKANQGKIKQGK